MTPHLTSNNCTARLIWPLSNRAHYFQPSEVMCISVERVWYWEDLLLFNISTQSTNLKLHKHPNTHATVHSLVLSLLETHSNDWCLVFSNYFHTHFGKNRDEERQHSGLVFSCLGNWKFYLAFRVLRLPLTHKNLRKTQYTKRDHVFQCFFLVCRSVYFPSAAYNCLQRHLELMFNYMKLFTLLGSLFLVE